MKMMLVNVPMNI